jgi:DNA-binding NarL/FixJ family response regulator
LSKLTERQVKLIKERLARGESASKIADELGLGRSTIFDIKRGLTWRYVTI